MRKIFTSIWFLALLLSVPVIILSIPLFLKYEIDEITTRRNAIAGKSNVYFEDLNGDGVKEIIDGYEDLSGIVIVHSIQYFSHNGAIYDQLNMAGTYHRSCRLLSFGDVNKNDLKEIYAFSMKADSLMLSVFEPFNPDWCVRSIFVTQIDSNLYNYFDPEVSEGQFIDFNKDGYEDFIFTVNGGYSVYPRSIFMLDGKKFQITHTPSTGNCNRNIQVVENRGTKELTLVVDGEASFNIEKQEVKILSDRRPYLKVFDEKLNFKIDPIPFYVGIGGQTKTIPVIINDTTYYYTLFNSPSVDSPNPTLYKIAENGVKLDSIRFDVKQRSWYTLFEKLDENEFCVICENGIVRMVDNELSLTKKKRLRNRNNLVLQSLVDLNGDLIDEFVFNDIEDQKTVVYTESFGRYYELEQYLTVQKDCKIDNDVFFGFDATRTYNYQFKINPLRFLIIPFSILVYFGWIGFLWLIRKGQEMRMKERYELQSRFSDLQLAAFRNQLHPHFIFNTFNGIISVAMQGRKEEAYDLFTKFSNVLRASLQSTESVLVSLSDELLLVKNFLDIQQFRFKDLFEYELDIQEDIETENVFIPKMIIQIHVENSIKHGLKPMGQDGWIKVRVRRITRGIINIIIEDNGVGREKSKMLETSGTGLGIKTVNQFIKQVNEQKKIFVDQEIVDLYGDDGLPLGTKIDISIKGKKKYEHV